MNLGPIDDLDVTWFNGSKVGSGEQWDQPRSYAIPDSIVKAGRNVIAVRVLDTGGPGGIWGKPEELVLVTTTHDSFPFLFVQLANYMDPYPEPRDDDWAELREAQRMALAVKNAGMAVTIDIGEARDIHPRNKREVGRRLALIARNRVYGHKLPYSGPVLNAMTLKEGRAHLTFDYVEAGLIAGNGNVLQGFAIAGADRKFHYAQAAIAGNAVVVWSPKVARPVAVRYAWAANPICNLYNSAGLPASPFRTDTWPGITQ